MSKMILKPVSAQEVSVKMNLANQNQPTPPLEKAAPAEQPAAPIVDKPLLKPEDGAKLAEIKAAETKIPDGEKPAEVKLDDKGNPIVEDEKPVRKKAKEISKPFFEKKEKIIDAKPDEIPEPLKARFTTLESENAEYKKLLANPNIQAMIEAGKLGKNAFDVFDEVRGNMVDPNKMTGEQLYEYELRKAGVKNAADLTEDSTETSFEDEMQKFRDMPKPARDREIAAIKKELNDERANKTETFLSQLKNVNSQSDADTEKLRQASLKTQQDFNNLCDQYVGKEHYSVVGTPQMVESMKNLINSGELIPRNEDGSLDAQVLFDFAHYRLFGDLRLENLENQFFAEGVESLEKKIEARGDAGKIIRMPQGTPNAGVDAGRETFKSIRPVSK